ncbi:MAG TPA: PDZ domain-containing protein [Kofleriaceae bacterium]
MRLVSAILFVALTGSAVVAEEAKPADPKPEVTKKKVPYRVVKMLPETEQVLLFDKIKGNHVVAEVGQALDGYTVDQIDDDEVTLIAENGASVILTTPPPPRQPKRAKKPQAPVDPYAEPGEVVAGDVSADATSGAGKPSGEVPVDPYAEPAAPQTPGEGGVRVASASAPSTATAAPIVDAGPATPYDDPGIAAFAEAVGATQAPATKAPTKPGKAAKGKATKAKPTKAPASPDAAADLAAAATGAPATVSAGGAASTPVAPGTTMVARAELDAALGDFGKTAGTFRAAFTADGLRFDYIVEGSLLAKVGLRKGDVVTYVDGKPLRSLDDAASLYARAGALRATTVQVTRDGKNVTLRVAIQ